MARRRSSRAKASARGAASSSTAVEEVVVPPSEISPPEPSLTAAAASLTELANQPSIITEEITLDTLRNALKGKKRKAPSVQQRAKQVAFEPTPPVLGEEFDSLFSPPVITSQEPITISEPTEVPPNTQQQLEEVDDTPHFRKRKLLARKSVASTPGKSISQPTPPEPQKTPRPKSINAGKKKKKAVEEASTSEPPSEVPSIEARFDSSTALRRYRENTAKRSLIAERGIKMYEMSTSLPNVYAVIMINKWDKFVSRPPLAVVPLVKEFYASIYRVDSWTTRIRGVEVDFSPSAINALFELDEVDDTEFLSHVDDRSRDDIQDFLRRIAKPGARTGSTRRKRSTILEQCYLNNSAKVLYLFIVSRLLPTSHVGQVSRVRILILWFLFCEKKINVGRMIAAEMKETALADFGSFGYPSIITMLCKKAGVPIGEDEEKLVAKKMLDSEIEPRRVARQDGEEEQPSLSSFANLEKKVNKIYRRQKRLKDFHNQVAHAIGRRLDTIMKKLKCPLPPCTNAATSSYSTPTKKLPPFRNSPVS